MSRRSASSAQRGSRSRTSTTDEIRPAEQPNFGEHHDRKPEESRQTFDRRRPGGDAAPSPQSATATVENPKVDRIDTVGIPLPEEPAVAEPRNRLRASLADRLLNISSLGELRAPTPLIDRLLYRGTLAQLSGPAGSYKSFLAIAIACSVASGTDLDGQPVGKPEPVVYVAAEGAAGLRARILAWCEHHGIDPATIESTLRVLPMPVQLRNVSTDVTEAAALADELRAALVILDTRSKCTLGLEENSNTEQAKAVEAAERISIASGATVLAIHHTGRTGSTPRGATAWDGGVWSDLRIDKGKDLAVTIRCEKHKDAPSGCVHGYQLVEHRVTKDAMPDASANTRSTLVCVSRGSKTPDLSSSSDSLIVEALRETPGLTVAELVTVTGIAKSTVHRRINVLLEGGIALKSGSRYSLTTAAVAQWGHV